MSGNTLDPFIALIRNAEGDNERATVLLEAPVLTLLRWRSTFADYCRRAAFHEGIVYLDLLADTMGKPRHRGNLAGTMPMSGITATLLNIADGGAA
ncbi:hypothetical protein EFV37_25160 [Mesorhizobium loti]|uniref:Uncharacterized protein n=1 Tax=Mesorhizobium jarvisii TaxID=1777867 RepID=A0A6M7TJX8_9HYPH|nr:MULTISPECIES: hypothetical protein [Mesorhizobium]OBQ68392.1 hypothetical protein A9K72_09055 [Mesorhizobium loti]QKC65189.1 hypothetical protein EB229_25155 [Mesorhizobium jarvisii]QKD11104.1 hypothetical protein EFV37_25160 [Mesorhizobium loti]RJT31090.1 hypothetical protein D3242_22780 [Mesorhizobium jarvisii]